MDSPGHEAVGTVEFVGSGVKNVAVGDRVLVSCITACGACRYCRGGSYGQCLGGGGWILGHKIDGTQAEYVRVPFADTSTHPGPSRPAWSTPTRPRPSRLAQGHQVDAGRFVTHRFTLDQFDEAYDVFSRPADTGALKVVLTRT